MLDSSVLRHHDAGPFYTQKSMLDPLHLNKIMLDSSVVRHHNVGFLCVQISECFALLYSDTNVGPFCSQIS
jgi:hypothetical protein